MYCTWHTILNADSYTVVYYVDSRCIALMEGFLY